MCVGPRLPITSRTRRGRGKPAPLRPGAKRAVQITGDDGHLGSGQHQPDARLELAQFAGRAPRSLGKQQQDVARVLQQLPAEREALADVAWRLKGKALTTTAAIGQPRNADEEEILGGGGKHAMQLADAASPKGSSRRRGGCNGWPPARTSRSRAGSRRRRSASDDRPAASRESELPRPAGRNRPADRARGGNSAAARPSSGRGLPPCRSARAHGIGGPISYQAGAEKYNAAQQVVKIPAMWKNSGVA